MKNLSRKTDIRWILTTIPRNKKMSKKVIYEFLSDSDIQEWLECSKEFLTAVDEVIEVTPLNSRASTKEKILRFFFMDARTTVYDIYVLAESLLTNDRHHFSRAIESSRRLLFENTIDYFYISESDDLVAERRAEFMLYTNSIGNDREKRKEAFEQKYGKLRGDYWSGKSREEKVAQGMQKYPPLENDKSFAGIVKPTFDWLNEQVHGNTMVALYWSFDKHGSYKDEYRRQITTGLLSLILFYLLSHAYCNFTGRGSEVERFGFYKSYIIEKFAQQN